MTSLNRTSSWVICERDTGRAVYETYSSELVERINRERYIAVPVLEYLQSLNRQIMGH